MSSFIQRSIHCSLRRPHVVILALSARGSTIDVRIWHTLTSDSDVESRCPHWESKLLIMTVNPQHSLRCSNDAEIAKKFMMISNWKPFGFHGLFKYLSVVGVILMINEKCIISIFIPLTFFLCFQVEHHCNYSIQTIQISNRMFFGRNTTAVTPFLVVIILICGKWDMPYFNISSPMKRCICWIHPFISRGDDIFSFYLSVIIVPSTPLLKANEAVTAYCKVSSYCSRFCTTVHKFYLWLSSFYTGTITGCHSPQLTSIAAGPPVAYARNVHPVKIQFLGPALTHQHMVWTYTLWFLSHAPPATIAADFVALSRWWYF